MKRPSKNKPAIQHGDTRDISKDPADSINGRFHALGFTKHYEQDQDWKPLTHVFTRGNEVYKNRNCGAAIAQLELLEKQK